MQPAGVLNTHCMAIKGTQNKNVGNLVVQARLAWDPRTPGALEEGRNIN